MGRVAGGRDHVDRESRVAKCDSEPGRIRPFECGGEQDPRGHDAETAGGRLDEGTKLLFGLRAPATRREAKPAP